MTSSDDPLAELIVWQTLASNRDIAAHRGQVGFAPMSGLPKRSAECRGRAITRLMQCSKRPCTNAEDLT
jgi:hypothetical protein